MEDAMKSHAALLRSIVDAGWKYKRATYTRQDTFAKDIGGFPVKIFGTISDGWTLDIPALGREEFDTLGRAFKRAKEFETEFLGQ